MQFVLVSCIRFFKHFYVDLTYTYFSLTFTILVLKLIFIFYIFQLLFKNFIILM